MKRSPDSFQAELSLTYWCGRPDGRLRPDCIRGLQHGTAAKDDPLAKLIPQTHCRRCPSHRRPISRPKGAFRMPPRKVHFSANSALTAGERTYSAASLTPVYDCAKYTHVVGEYSVAISKLCEHLNPLARLIRCAPVAPRTL